MMKLSHLLEGVEVLDILGPGAASASDLAIAEIREDSRQVQTGDLFVAVPGQTVDGHRFLQDAAEMILAPKTLRINLVDVLGP